MGPKDDQLAVFCCTHNPETVVRYGPRQHIFIGIESVEQKELPFALVVIALRKAGKRFGAARFICLNGFLCQDRRNRCIHVWS